MATTEEIRAELATIVNDVEHLEELLAAEDPSVPIPDEDSKNLRTVGDAVAYIERAQA